MRKLLLMMAVMMCAAISLQGVCTAELSVLAQDGNENPSSDDLGVYTLGYFNVGEAVKLTPPNPGWTLRAVRILGTSFWNNSSESLPDEMFFMLEIRDSDLNLLYKTFESQLDYFLFSDGVGWAYIEVPPITIDKDFYICFYDRGAVGVGLERNVTEGTSFRFDRETRDLYPTEFIDSKTNTTSPFNWLITAVGE